VDGCHNARLSRGSRPPIFVPHQAVAQYSAHAWRRVGGLLSVVEQPLEVRTFLVRRRAACSTAAEPTHEDSPELDVSVSMPKTPGHIGSAELHQKCVRGEGEAELGLAPVVLPELSRIF
jgi:hypothetical protein